MNYSPRRMQVWDAWYMPVDGVVHAYHLQRWRPPAPQGPAAREEDALGHAVTRNLLDWEERKPAFWPAEGNPLDDMQPWSGCAIWHNHQAHMFYTMRGSASRAQVQAVGLATSPDGDHFTHYPGNPVVLTDPRWFAVTNDPVPGYRDCRDLQVVPDPRGGGFYGFYATRTRGPELPMTGAFGCVYSTDLLHWEQRGPAFTPGKYACVEFPDVFELNGKWYLTCLAGNFYGNRDVFTDPNLGIGTIYAVADRPEGPYVELADNALAAARTTAVLSIRSFDFEGERVCLYTDRERTGHTDGGEITFGTLATPKVLRTSGDRLWISYSPRIEAKVTRELVGSSAPATHHVNPRPWGQHWPMPAVAWSWGDTIEARSQSGWGVAPLGQRSEAFILEADVLLHEDTVAAGFAFRFVENRCFAIAGIDARRQEAFYADAPDFDFLEQRQTPLPYGTWLHLRLVNRREHIELYVNDDLRVAFSRYRGLGGEVGLWLDRGHAQFRNIRMRELQLAPAER